jgi:hypothetical protein
MNTMNVALYRHGTVSRDNIDNEEATVTTKETPLQRFKRLQFEVTEFVEEMELLSKKV